MIATPPVVVHCVEATAPAAQQAKAIIDIAGAAATMDAVLARVRAPTWRVISDEIRDGRRRVSIAYGRDVLHQGLGGFIYAAQQAGLTINGRFDPPICGTDNN